MECWTIARIMRHRRRARDDATDDVERTVDKGRDQRERSYTESARSCETDRLSIGDVAGRLCKQCPAWNCV